MTKQEAIQRLMDTEDPVDLCEYATGFKVFPAVPWDEQRFGLGY